jgi:two-component system cell cycle sensor histidine kinase/response regulator CckA
VKNDLPSTGNNDNPKSVSVEKDIFDQIINHSRSMISVINREYVYEKVNTTFCREHQILNDSIVGKSLSDVWGDNIFRSYIKNKIDLCFSGETVRYEASFNTPRLGERYYEVIFQPLNSGNRGITHLMAETFDIHDLRLYRQEAHDREEELRKIEIKLLQAQNLETIGALAGGIAHDFNNILATISGYSEILQEDLPKDSFLSDNVSKIQGAVRKAQSLINQILTFSRHVEQEKIQVNVAEVLKETIGFIRSSIPPNVVIKSRIPNRSENVLADPTQLFRVFLNLMTNAYQSMEENGGTLSVSLSVVEVKNVQHELNKDIVADEYILVTFADTGKGMESSMLDRIFEPFFTTREVGKGTGLGLSVIYGIIAEMEGEILVSSLKEKGSTFYLYLPVDNEYNNITGSDEIRKKILFITGNKHESRILSIALEKSGYDLLFMADRRNLIKIMDLDQERPDLIIYMSESKEIRPEDLIAVFHQLKVETPCILITDSNQDLIEEKLLNSGIIKQHLVKPVSLKEIRNAILVSLS